MGSPMDNANPNAPDGGWGWVVCFGSFMLQALTIGITYTFGIIFVDLLDYFETTEAETAWIGSIQPCLLYFTGIVAGPLLLRFGWRIIAISGAVLSCIGFTASAFAPHLWVLYLTYGVLTGVGNGLMYVTSMVAVQHYFSSKRAMATGLAVSGSGVGTLVFGVVIQLLLDNLGWRYTLLVNAGICLVVGSICGSLFRPLSEDPETEKVKTDPDSSDDEIDEKTLLHASPSARRLYYGTGSPRSSISGVSKVSSLPTHKEEAENETEITFRANPGCYCCCCGPCNSPFCQIVGEIFDPTLFKNPVFLIFSIVLIFFSFGYHTPYTYVPERAIELGIGTTKASLLVSVMGISNVAARLIFGWIADKSPKIRFYFAGIVFCLGGLFTILVFLFETYPAMVGFSVIFGGCSGCFAALFPVILVDLLGIDLIEKSLGQALAMASVGFLFASPMSGWIIDQTGSFDVPFIVVGAMELFGGVLYFTIKLFIPKYGYKPIEDVEPPELAIEKKVAQLMNQRTRTRSRMISESFA